MAQDRFVEVYSQGVTNVRKIIVDTQTGVNYLLMSSNMTGGSGITVLVDVEGKPVVTPLGENDPVALGQLLDRE
ncbi:DUF6440 family protein [Enorma phocaeensis]|uniref:DUF6440 family protein n=1 Tax=Enorma phocaeensis TaxID=1871019 RepID=UPI00195E1DD4|nr:DUF6440 family protein [Enorma phocaeensis]MBM6952598.1 xylan 1,4-beta-xylosidase [Enorma phocaeensis]